MEEMTRIWQEHSQFIYHKNTPVHIVFCIHCLAQETKLRSFHSRLSLVSKIGFESATRIQENFQCIKPSFLQHPMWNAGGVGILMQEGTVSKGDSV
jgi:hypothetical protein